MLERYSFVPVFSCLLGGMAWWTAEYGPTKLDLSSKDIGLSQTQRNKDQYLRRQEILEYLDRVVSYQHYYHSVYGKYSESLDALGLESLAVDNFSIRVDRATKDSFRVLAVEIDSRKDSNPILGSEKRTPQPDSQSGTLREEILASQTDEKPDSLETRESALVNSNGPEKSENPSRKMDVVSINESFDFQANFEKPHPRSGYLRLIALKHMRALSEAQSRVSAAEPSIYKGFFDYSIEPIEGRSEVLGDSKDSSLFTRVVARGVRPPVLGVYLEYDKGSPGSLAAAIETEIALLGQSQSLQADSDEEGEFKTTMGEGPRVGEHKEVDRSLEEETRLAQQIFRGEVGRYARNWNELSRIVNFEFKGHPENLELQRRFFQGSDLYTSEAGITQELDQNQGPKRQISSEPALPSGHSFLDRSFRTKGGLEVEAITEEEASNTVSD